MTDDVTSPKMLSAIISALHKSGHQVDHDKIERVIHGLIAQRDALAAKVEALEKENTRLLRVTSLATSLAASKSDELKRLKGEK